MATQKGNIQINTENIFPIIKRWLYSDKDIFIRELISNCCDAITKLNKLTALGEYSSEDSVEINILCDEKAGTLSFTDNGIGMTAEEVDKYINQVAFSSAEEFLTKYKNADDSNQIIGHFGLGFYSAFMVSKRVEVNTLSWQEGAEAVKWSCDGDTQFEMTDSDKKDRGTTVTLYLDDDSREFLNRYSVEAVVSKYCSFLPYPIYVHAQESDNESEEQKPINDTHPLWLEKAQDITEEQYKTFYHKVFTDFEEPLFWIHLNVDYPFNLKGILYFPKLSHQFDSIEGQIKLYSNQVFVADNIKEVIPEYLMMLKGVIDCPDLPLNVSRSFLQNDKDVQKIPAYITRKIADRLTGMFKNEYEEYAGYWKDIHPFVKYGCIRDEKFYDRMRDCLLFGKTTGGFTTIQSYLDENGEKLDNKIYYTNDSNRQAATIAMYKDAEIPVLVLDAPIDAPLISFLETKLEKVSFVRIDSELPAQIKGESNLDEADVALLEAAFRRALGNDKQKVVCQSLKDASTPAVVRLDEFMRRYQEMNMMRQMESMDQSFFADQAELVLNPENAVVGRILTMAKEEKDSAFMDNLCRQVFDIAKISAGMMKPEELASFIRRTNDLLIQSVAEN